MRTDAPQGTAPRVVLDIKMIHPDIGNSLAPAIGIFTNLPFRDGKGRPLLANQLLEKLVGLDGDSGRTTLAPPLRPFFSPLPPPDVLFSASSDDEPPFAFADDGPELLRRPIPNCLSSDDDEDDEGPPALPRTTTSSSSLFPLPFTRVR